LFLFEIFTWCKIVAISLTVKLAIGESDDIPFVHHPFTIETVHLDIMHRQDFVALWKVLWIGSVEDLDVRDLWFSKEQTVVSKANLAGRDRTATTDTTIRGCVKISVHIVKSVVAKEYVMNICIATPSIGVRSVIRSSVVAHTSVGFSKVETHARHIDLTGGD
jgi:hypothetical protein